MGIYKTFIRPMVGQFLLQAGVSSEHKNPILGEAALAPVSPPFKKRARGGSRVIRGREVPILIHYPMCWGGREKPG